MNHGEEGTSMATDQQASPEIAEVVEALRRIGRFIGAHGLMRLVILWVAFQESLMQEGAAAQAWRNGRCA
jgi:hypothetical protein